LLAGDFDAVLSPEDSSSEHITKRQTTNLLLKISHGILPYYGHGWKQHIWYRRSTNKFSLDFTSTLLIYQSHIKNTQQPLLSWIASGLKPLSARKERRNHES
jgi:hypothetical protein